MVPEVRILSSPPHGPGHVPGSFGKGGRAVEGTGLENRQSESSREFESRPFRHEELLTASAAFYVTVIQTIVKMSIFMSWYQRAVLPRLLTFVMRSDELKIIRKEVISHAAGDVLEIGYGPGFNLPFYRNIKSLTALEPLNKLVEEARRQYGPSIFPVTFIQSSAEKIPLLDASIDTVVSTWTLCSVQNPNAVLQEIKRVLRPGGKLVFIDHGVSPRAATQFMQKIVTPFTKMFTGNCHLDRNIERLVLEAGFRIDSMQHPIEPSHPLMYNFQGIASVHH